MRTRYVYAYTNVHRDSCMRKRVVQCGVYVNVYLCKNIHTASSNLNVNISDEMGSYIFQLW